MSRSLKEDKVSAKLNKVIFFKIFSFIASDVTLRYNLCNAEYCYFLVRLVGDIYHRSEGSDCDKNVSFHCHWCLLTTDTTFIG